MRNKLLKALVVALAVLALLMGVSFLKREAPQSNSLVVASNFAGYDFARAVLGDAAMAQMLLKPGAEAHDFEPTPEDIIAIKNAGLFIYVGGESEQWVEKLLQNSEIPPEKTLRLMDFVETKLEEVAPGMDASASGDGATEYDEHIWTSPVNAMRLVTAIRDKLSELYPDQASIYQQNAGGYLARLARIDQDLRAVAQNSPQKELVFGDRFPFRYLADEYGLSYFAAFPGCLEQTEASSGTLAFLIDKVKKDGIKVVLKIELTSGQLAQTIAAETGAKVLELHSAHNISLEDFTAGRTYADIMESNVQVLREALQ